ncbi:MAG: DEAD/DEAH box helicase [Candidatus Thermoplasmatota archaeon]|nr:DEAD/DEAH box helicase [Candidatus Thermoplasmatota archaeon]
MYLSHPFINEHTIEFREYQVTIAASAARKNTLIVLPTGLGKTVIALLVIAAKIKKSPNKKILFLAPTKPLVTQHSSFLRSSLSIDPENITVFTGEVNPKQRINLWNTSSIVVSTPQVIENDLVSKKISLHDVSLIIYDEAHHATGKYAYVFIHERYQHDCENAHSIGMTASPGNDREKILDVCRNLSIDHVEIRSKYDSDVKPYVHDLEISWKKVIPPQEFSYAVQLFRKVLTPRLQVLYNVGAIESSSVSTITKTKLLDAQKIIQTEIKSRVNPPKTLFTAAATQSEAIKLYYIMELLQTQGVEATKRFFHRLSEESKQKNASRSAKNLLKDAHFLEAAAYINSLKIEHPKLDEVARITKDQLQTNPDSRIIVFTQYRDTSKMVFNRLKTISPIKPVRFIGQAAKTDDKGLTQKEQEEIIARFRKGTYNVLIATSVAEEGLDIPSTDLVVFYEPIPSEIRNIQRRGRTARKMAGKLVILITKGTVDEGYYWASKRREKKMKSDLTLLRAQLEQSLAEKPTGYTSQTDETDKPIQKNVLVNNQKKLDEFHHQTENNTISIVVDHRESRSTVARALTKQSIHIISKQLVVGDYVVSSRIGVERKSVDDFLNSLLNGQLFSQLQRLRDAYPRPVLILEGQGLFTKRNINHKAIYGTLISILVDFGIPILSTNDETETADLLSVMAKREQRQENKSIALRGSKSSCSLAEKQRFIVEGFPNISSLLAKRLLSHFGSIHLLVNASEKELQEVNGIGKQTAKLIYSVLREDYHAE